MTNRKMDFDDRDAWDVLIYTGIVTVVAYAALLAIAVLTLVFAGIYALVS